MDDSIYLELYGTRDNCCAFLLPELDLELPWKLDKEFESVEIIEWKLRNSIQKKSLQKAVQNAPIDIKGGFLKSDECHWSSEAL